MLNRLLGIKIQTTSLNKSKFVDQRSPLPRTVFGEDCVVIQIRQWEDSPILLGEREGCGIPAKSHGMPLTLTTYLQGLKRLEAHSHTATAPGHGYCPG